MKSPSTFSLLLFSVRPSFIRSAVASGVEGIVVDWERNGKERRQASADTEINRNTFDDLVRVRACTDAAVICRINGFCESTGDEIEQAIEGGADEILLPMVRTVEEVQAVLDSVRGRCGVGLLVETAAALPLAEALGRLPLSRAYVGLNDLAIQRKTANIFTALTDNTVDRIRRYFDMPFGFGGLTIPEGGAPIPCRLLMGEMARLQCRFSFLRRTFHRDVTEERMAEDVPRILAAMGLALGRSGEQIRDDRRKLTDAVRAWYPEPVLSGTKP